MAKRFPREISFKDQLAELAYCLNELTDEQGPRGRRNARATVTAAIAKLKRAVDARFPGPPRQRGEKADYSRLTPAQVLVIKKRKLRTQGFTEAVLDSVQLRRLAEAGVELRTLKRPDDGREITFIPAWAEVVLNRVPGEKIVGQLRRCKTDVTHRKALVVEHTLRDSAQLAQTAQQP